MRLAGISLKRNIKIFRVDGKGVERGENSLLRDCTLGRYLGRIYASEETMKPVLCVE